MDDERSLKVMVNESEDDGGACKGVVIANLKRIFLRKFTLCCFVKYGKSNLTLQLWLTFNHFDGHS